MLRIAYLTLFSACIACQCAAGRSDLKLVTEANDDLTTILDRTYKVSSTDYFNVFYDPYAADYDKISYLLDLAYHHFESLFNSYNFVLRPPQAKLTWIAFKNKESFNRYAIETEGRDLSWLSGYYSTGTNIVAVVTPEKMSKWQVKAERNQTPDVIACPPDAQTDLVKIVHETAHQLSFNTGLQKRGVKYPIWASEGLAMFFERSLLSEYFHSCRYTSLRARRLTELYRRGNLIPLDEFITMTRLDETSSAIDIYAQAWGLFHFLCEHRTKALRTYFSNLYAHDPGWKSERTLHDEFVKAFGSLDQLDRQWMRFLETLSVR